MHFQKDVSHVRMEARDVELDQVRFRLYLPCDVPLSSPILHFLMNGPVLANAKFHNLAFLQRHWLTLQFPHTELGALRCFIVSHH